MKNITITLFLLFTLVNEVYAQIDSSAFIFTFGGSDNSEFLDIREAPGHTYIAVGYRNTFDGNGSTRIYLMKLDSGCNRVWSKVIGGSGISMGYSVTPTFDNGFAIAGYTNSSGAGGYDVYLVKTDSLGNVIWTKTYGGSDWDFGYSIAQTLDSGFVICGGTYSFGYGDEDAYLIKADKNGNSMMEKTYGGAEKDAAYSVIVTKDSNYVFVGETSSFGHGGADVYLSKISFNGDSLWSQAYGDTLDDVAYSVVETLDSGYAMAGYSKSFSASGNEQIYYLKADSIGNFKWQQTAGPDASQNYGGKHIVELPDGELFITGFTAAGGGGSDVACFITDSYGNFNGDKSASYGSSGNDVANSNILSSDGDFLMAGYTDSPTWTCGFENGMVILAHVVKPGAVQVVSVDCDSIDGVIENSLIDKNIFIYPNPFSDFTSIYFPTNVNVADIDIVLYDMISRKINIKETPTGNRIDILDADLPAGVYFLMLYSKKSGFLGSGKIIAN